MKEKIEKTKKERGVRTIAISQILILVIATIAFSWMVGSEFKTVSAAGGESCGSGTAIGTCIDTSTTGCEGSLLTGACSGGNNIKCCVPSTASECKVCEGDVVYFGNLVGGKCTPDYGKMSTTCPGGYSCSNGNCVEGSGNGDGGGGITFGSALNIATGFANFVNLGVNGYNGITKLINKGTGSKMIGDKASEIAQLQELENGAPGYGTKTVTTTGTGSGGHFWSKLYKTLFKAEKPVGQIFQNAGWAVLAYFLINEIAMKWSSERNQRDMQTWTQIGGAAGMVTVIVWAAIASGSGGPPGWVAAAVVVVFAALFMVVGYQKYSKEVFTFRVSLWQPTSIGSECNKCNALTINGQKACSEYVCHSYGTACDWVNTKTEYESCVEVSQTDNKPPVIKPIKEAYGQNVFPAINNVNYEYSANAAGAKIIYTGDGAGIGQCVPAYTPLTLAFNTSENAECRLSLEPSTGGTVASTIFTNMKDLAEGTVYTINHTLNLPAAVTADPASMEAAGYALTSGGNYKFYIRCKDVRGNINTVDYIMQFCVQQGPDITPPDIISTDPASGAYITYGITNITNFQIITSKPADCRWDTRPSAYSNMAHNFEWCSKGLEFPLSGFDYGCVGNLTAFKSGVDNTYYIACRDHPEYNVTMQAKRNTGKTESILLKGTTRLLIQSVTINGKPNNSLIRGSGETVDVNLEVHTSGGADNGNARCMYSENGIDYSLFSNGGSVDYTNANSETLTMPPADYKLFIQCYDLAERIPNINNTMIRFSVEIDKTPPTVVRLYKDEETNALKLITDEKAECVYDNYNSLCDYAWENGTAMSTENGIEHYVDWNPELNFYIKCRNEFGIMPLSGCSIEARPFEIFQLQ